MFEELGSWYVGQFECFLFRDLVFLSDVWVRSDDRRESGRTSYILCLAAPTPPLRAALTMCTAMPILENCEHQGR